jgi:hypothetical protein
MECAPISPSTFLEGVQVVFAAHFVFNIAFNEKNAKLMIFIENFFLGHFTEKNRADKTSEVKLGPVHTLISKIRKFALQDQKLKKNDN